MASKRGLRRKQCGAKVKYTSQDAANKALGAFFTRLLTPMHAYKCQFCKHWHLGHYTNKPNSRFKIT